MELKCSGKKIESAGKQMKKTKKVIVIMCIIIGIFFGFIVLAGIIAFKQFINGEVDITDITISISINTSSSYPSYSVNSKTEQKADLKWYETLEEALQNDELIYGEAGSVDYKESDALELVQIQTANKLVVFYTRVPKEGNIPRIYCVFTEVKDGKFSQPYKTFTCESRAGITSSLTGKTTYSYDCDDSAAFYIVQEAVIRSVSGNSEDQVPVCFGMWTNKAEIESLTVAGQAPKIIPVVAEEDTRYFWYFENVDWLDRLEAINWSRFTYGQVINLLEIKYDKAEED